MDMLINLAAGDKIIPDHIGMILNLLVLLSATLFFFVKNLKV